MITMAELEHSGLTQKMLDEVHKKTLKFGKVLHFKREMGQWYQLFPVAKKRPTGERIVEFKGKKLQVIGKELPSALDLDVMLGIVKLFEDCNMDVYEAGQRRIGLEPSKKRDVSVRGVKVSRRQLCEYCGVAYNSGKAKDIKKTLMRLRTTTVFEYDGEDLIRTWNLVADLAWGKSGATGYKEDRVEIIMGSEFLQICSEHRHKVHYELIQQMTSQVAKLLILYLDCNNNLSGRQTYPESWLFKYFFQDTEPKLQEGATPDEQRVWDENRKKYLERRKQYRLYVNDAMTAVTQTGLLESADWDKKTYVWHVVRPWVNK